MVLLALPVHTRRPGTSWTALAAPLLIASGVVVLVSLVVTVAAWRLQVAAPGSAPIAALQWFDVSSERNVPTAWSTLLLLSCATAAALLAVRGRGGGAGVGVGARRGDLRVPRARRGPRAARAARRVGGRGPAALHLGRPRRGAGRRGRAGAAAAPALAARRGPPRLVVAGAVYLTGALVLETVSGQVLRAHEAGGGKAYTLVTSLEEGLEMAGASLLLGALLLQLRYAKPGRCSSSTGRTGTSASS